MNYSLILNKRLQIIYIDENIESIGINVSGLHNEYFLDLIDLSNKINKNPRVFIKNFDKKSTIDHLILNIDNKTFKFYNFTFEKIILLRNTYFSIRFSDYEIDDELFEFIFDNNEDYLILLNKDYKIIKLNKKIINEFKFNNLDVTGKSILSLYQQKDRAKINRMLNESSIKQSELFQIPMFTENGKKISVETEIKETTMNSEKVYLVTSKDIKEKQKYENDLKMIEQKFINFFHSSDKAMSINDFGTGELMDVNKAFLEFFGFEQYRIQGKNFMDLKIFNKRIWSNFKKEIIESGNIKKDEYVIISNNQKHTVSFEAYIIESKNKTSLFFSFEEINEDRKSKKTLLENENYLDFLSDIGKEGYWDWNIKTDEIKISKKLADMLGYKMEEINKTFSSWLKAIHPEDKRNVITNLNQYFKNKTKEFSSEYRMLTKSGSYIWILNNAKIYKKNKQGEPLIMLGKQTDITERKLLEIDFFAKKQKFNNIPVEIYKPSLISTLNNEVITYNPIVSELKEGDKAATELQQNEKLILIGKKTSSIVHDFNNILQIIQIYNDLASESIKNKQNPEKCFEEVNSATLRGKKMINSILTIGDEQIVKMQSKDIKLVLDVALEFIKPTYPNTIDFYVDLEKCGKVICNSREIQRCLIVIFNIICKRINYNGIINISLKLKKQNKTNLNYAEISIDNESVFLNNHILNGGNVNKKNYKPLRISMDKKWALVSEIINNHNGFIEVESELDLGIKVKINLPIIYEQENIID
jgi:PAS domain S-box-containing protein